MNKISVSKKVDGGGLTLLDIDTVLFIEYNRGINRILFHTVDNIYYTIGNLVYWLGLLNANGYKFARADRNGIISLDKIKHMVKCYVELISRMTKAENTVLLLIRDLELYSLELLIYVNLNHHKVVYFFSLPL